jgi:hypothetical protein
MHAPLTTHAKVRMQQRGIPESALDVLLDFGRERYDHRGCTIVLIDKRARRRIERALGHATYRVMEPHLNAYAVVGADGEVRTVGHRFRRVPCA